jgi:hypothetical protein
MKNIIFAGYCPVTKNAKQGFALANTPENKDADSGGQLALPFNQGDFLQQGRYGIGEPGLSLGTGTVSCPDYQ